MNGYPSLLNFDIGGFFKEKMGKLGEIGSSLLESVGNLFGGDDEVKERYMEVPLQSGDYSLVGERGPELIKMGSPGMVIPAKESAQMMGVAAPELQWSMHQLQIT